MRAGDTHGNNHSQSCLCDSSTEMWSRKCAVHPLGCTKCKVMHIVAKVFMLVRHLLPRGRMEGIAGIFQCKFTMTCTQVCICKGLDMLCSCRFECCPIENVTIFYSFITAKDSMYTLVILVFISVFSRLVHKV